MFHTYYFYIALVPSIILHEVSHGWVANFFGDPTAKNAKRLSLNPMVHIDPFGTILLPALLISFGLPLFGYARPVPVNTSRLRKPRQQSLYVSLAGPLMNIVLSGIGLVMCDLAVSNVYGQLVVTNQLALLRVDSPWASRTSCWPSSTCCRFRRSTARRSSNASSRTGTSARTTTGALGRCRSS